MRNKLINIALKNNGDYFRIKRDIEQGCSYPMSDVILDCEVVTILDEKYPKRLLRLDKPPYVLFCKGNIDLLKSDCISVVGSRKHSQVGKLICESVVINSKSTIVSGLAYGIDAIAHQEALRQNKGTIAVLGSGFDYIYPYQNIELAKIISIRGLLISEYPPYVKPLKRNFPMRNRIIAALSEQLYVCEARKKSGTRITADMALEIGNEIFCGFSPENKGVFDGNIELIEEGASIIEIKKP